MYHTLQGRLLVRLIALVKISSYYMEQGTVCHLAKVQFMSLIDPEYRSYVNGLVTIQLRDISPVLSIVDIGMLFGLTHLILANRYSLINSTINLCTFNKIY